MQFELAVSQKQVAPEEFLIQAASKVINEHVVFITHPPPVFVIQLLFGKYASHASLVVNVVGALAQVLG